MSVWRQMNWIWRVAAVTGLVFAGGISALSGYGCADSYHFASMPFSGIAIAGFALAGVTFFWARLVRSGGGGLLWAVLWTLGFAYCARFVIQGAVEHFYKWSPDERVGNLGICCLMVLIPLFLAAPQTWVGYRARRQGLAQSDQISRRVGYIGPVAGLGLTLAFLISIAAFRVAGIGWSTQTTCLWEVSHLTTVQFPASAKLQHGYVDMEPLGSMLLAKVTMSNADVDKFVAYLRSHHADVLHGPRGIYEGNGPSNPVTYPDWWKPESVNNQISVQGTKFNDWDTSNMIISLEDPRKATVYMFYYED